LAGGLALLVAILVTFVLLRPSLDTQVTGILLGSVMMSLWGILDDRYGLEPWQKLVGQALATGLLVAFGVQVQMTRIPAVDLLVTFLWMVGMANAFNFVDSMDGLALGLAAIASAFFMLVTIDSVQPVLSALSATILGATIGLFFFNAAPAKLFLGDSGSQLLGFSLASIAIAYVPGQAGLPQGVSWFTPILVLGVPIFDTSLVVFSRLRRRRPIYQPGRDHTYHRLVALGLDPTRSVLGMQVGAIVLGLVAFVLLGTGVVVANAVFGALLLVGVLSIVALGRDAG
jgi:UDP-GlcNAc:undecaprenyl-phosphate GlcNAc-1-phosphate transferase